MRWAVVGRRLSQVLRAAVEAAEEDSKLIASLVRPRHGRRRAPVEDRCSAPFARMISGCAVATVSGRLSQPGLFTAFWERAKPFALEFARSRRRWRKSKVTGESSLRRFEPEVNNRG